MTATIFAPATGVGRAAIAVLRLSGPSVAEALTALAGPLPVPRMATLRTLRDPAIGGALDSALVLWFPAPASFTGEDSGELHVHGGRAVVAAVLAALAALPGCRLAEPGEFTRRALLNGKMDLGAVEGLADLIEAETESQRRQALAQHDGALGAWVAVQRAHLLDALAAAESAIDFSDEADVAGDFADEVGYHVTALLDAIGQEIDRGTRAAHVREGFVVALVGPPNAGKSTLLNALAHREIAIVSPLAGTTRDPVEAHLDLDGYLVHVIDTAGLRASDDPIERQGMQRTRDRAAAADLVLWLTDIRHPALPDSSLPAGRLWRVGTKLDLLTGVMPADLAHAVAAPTGAGLLELIGAIKAVIDEGVAGASAVTTRARHRAILAAAATTLEPIRQAGGGMALELAAEHLRRATTCLDSLVGRIDNEEVLGAIFARFCVGK